MFQFQVYSIKRKVILYIWGQVNPTPLVPIGDMGGEALRLGINNTRKLCKIIKNKKILPFLSALRSYSLTTTYVSMKARISQLKQA